MPAIPPGASIHGCRANFNIASDGDQERLEVQNARLRFGNIAFLEHMLLEQKASLGPD